MSVFKVLLKIAHKKRLSKEVTNKRHYEKFLFRGNLIILNLNSKDSFSLFGMTTSYTASIKFQYHFYAEAYSKSKASAISL